MKHDRRDAAARGAVCDEIARLDLGDVAAVRSAPEEPTTVNRARAVQDGGSAGEAVAPVIARRAHARLAPSSAVLPRSQQNMAGWRSHRAPRRTTVSIFSVTRGLFPLVEVSVHGLPW